MGFTGDRIKLSLNNSISYSHLREIRHCMSYGGILIIPSDTCYSLASFPMHKKALRLLANIQPESATKEIPLSFASLKMLEDYCVLQSEDIHVIDEFCPGPITIVCEMKNQIIKDDLNDFIHTKGTIGARIPDSAVERQISEFLNSPITTCAVRDDQGKVVRNYDDVVDLVKKRVVGVISNYDIMAIQVPHFKYNESSTVFSLQSSIIGNYEIQIFREGVVSSKKIKSASKDLGWSDLEQMT